MKTFVFATDFSSSANRAAHFTIDTSKDIYKTIQDFAHAHESDLIMMMPQAHSWLRTLFSEGETHHMARLTDIPLLAVV